MDLNLSHPPLPPCFPSLFVTHSGLFSPVHVFHIYFQLSFLFVCVNTLEGLYWTKRVCEDGRVPIMGRDWGWLLKIKSLPFLEYAVDGCPACFEIAWTLPGKSSDTLGLLGLSDCYCCCLMAPSQPCLHSAGLSSKVDIVLFFLLCQSLTLLTCQTFGPGKFLSTWNASLCCWNLVPWHTAQTYC